MGKPSTIAAEELLAHGDWLHALARQLVVDAHRADDLVQEAWLAALQHPGAARFSLRSWLAGVMRNAAREQHRNDRRRVERERAAATSRRDGDPAEVLERVALHRKLTEQVVALDEPYRTTLLLRYFDALPPRVIAKRLQVPGSTVRNRLKRGLEMLRAQLDREHGGDRRAWCLALLPLVPPVHGVLPLIIGAGVMTTKAKVSIAAAVLLLAAGAAWWFVASDERTPSTRREDISQSMAAIASAESVAPRGAESAAAITPDRVAIAAPSRQPTNLSGTIVDAITDQPVAGATVALYAPRRTRLSEVKRRWWDFIEQDFHGGFKAIGTWPALDKEPTPLALLDREDVLVYDAPDEEASPIVETVTDGAGEFRLAAPDSGGVLACTHADYLPTIAPVLAVDQPVRVELETPRRLVGHVIDDHGKPMTTALKLLFRCLKSGPKDEQGNSRLLTVGAWLTETSANGSFDVIVGARRVSAVSRTPGWQLTNKGINPENGQLWVFLTTFPPTDDGKPIVLVAHRGPVLRVRDAATQRPIERFSLLSRETRNGSPRRSGVCYAPEGLLDLVRDEDLARLSKSAMAFDVWAPGYRPCTVEVANLSTADIVAVDLEPGEVARLDGVVLQAGAGVAGASVTLQQVYRLQWKVDQCHPIDASVTDDAGRFTLGAPPGNYVVRVTKERLDYFVSSEIPHSGALVIDLAARASLQVVVRDSLGAPSPAMPVFLSEAKGRHWKSSTDADGRCSFADLTPDGYTVIADAQGRKNQSFIPRDPHKITLAPGEARLLEITNPNEPVGHARVQVDQVGDYSHWRVRNTFHTGNPWQPIAGNGTLPLEIGESSALEIEDDAGHRWHAGVPHDAPDGFVIPLSLAGAGFDGEVVDYVTGKPLASIRVVAKHGDSGASAVTDASGRFHIGGLEAASHTITFNSNADAVAWDREGSRRHDMIFTPSEPAAAAPRFLRIRLPVQNGDALEGIPSVRVSGQVTERGTGQPLQNGIVSISAQFSQADGSLAVWFERGMATLNNEGRYQVSIVRAPRYKGWVKNDKTGKAMWFEWAPTGNENEETYDLVFE